MNELRKETHNVFKSLEIYGEIYFDTWIYQYYYFFSDIFQDSSIQS